VEQQNPSQHPLIRIPCDEAVKKNSQEGCRSSRDFRHPETPSDHLSPPSDLKGFINPVEITNQTRESGEGYAFPSHQGTFPSVESQGRGEHIPGKTWPSNG